MMILYSNNCNRCKILENKLIQKKVKYAKSDNFDVPKKNDMLEAPVLQLPTGKLLRFQEAIHYVNSIDITI